MPLTDAERRVLDTITTSYIGKTFAQCDEADLDAVLAIQSAEMYTRTEAERRLRGDA